MFTSPLPSCALPEMEERRKKHFKLASFCFEQTKYTLYLFVIEMGETPGGVFSSSSCLLERDIEDNTTALFFHIC
jgi:predicted metalloprotease with PDZ domain